MMYVPPGDEVAAVKVIDSGMDDPSAYAYLVFTRLGQVIKYEVDVTLGTSISNQRS